MSEEVDHKHLTEDVTGRDRLTWNVAVSWATQIVSIVVGFVMPRLIDESLGQVSLGIWDFGWSIVAYVALANLGIGSNSARYIARYRAEGNVSAMNSTASSAFVMQQALTVCLLGVLIYLYSIVDTLFDFEDVRNTGEVQLVVLLLGLAVIAQLMFDIYRGTLTGYHRWDLNNAINAVQQVFAALSMVTVLLSGGTLVHLAGVYLLATVAGEMFRMLCSSAICKDMRLSFKAISFSQAKRVSIYGAKNLVWVIGPVAVYQAVNILIATKLGPAALAIFARPAALMRYVDTFASKFAFVLTPTIGSLQKLGKVDELKDFVISMTRVSWLIAIPATTYLAVFGPEVVTLWMGEGYVEEGVIVLLALFRGVASTATTGYRLVFGLNAHGKLAWRGLLFSMLVLAIMVPLFLTGQMTLLQAAIVHGVISCGLAILVMYQVTRLIDMSMLRFAWQVSREALLIGLVSASVLIGLKQLMAGQIVVGILISGLVHAALVFGLYWVFALSDDQRNRIRDRIFPAIPDGD